MRLLFRCARASSGNGIVERSLRTIKRIASKRLYTGTKDNVHGVSALANALYRYERSTESSRWSSNLKAEYMKRETSSRGELDRNSLTVHEDGVPRRVKDLRLFPYTTNNPVKDEITASRDDEMYITFSYSGNGDDLSVESDLGVSSDGNDNEGQQLTMGPS